MATRDDERKAMIAQRVAEVRRYDERLLRSLDEPPLNAEDRRRKEAVRLNFRALRELEPDIEQVLGVAANPEDLRRTKIPYPEAIPVLLRQLERTDLPEAIWITIALAVAVPYARKEVFPPLVGHLRARYGTLSRHNVDQLGWAISLTARRRDSPILFEIVRNRRYDGARMMPLLKLARWRESGVIEIAIESLSETGWVWTGLRALRLAKAWDAASAVEPFLRSDVADFREEARAYFKALGAAHA